MARVIFGSILVPDNADEAYLKSLGLSEKSIKEALTESTQCKTEGEICDPLKEKADTDNTDSAAETADNTSVSYDNEGSMEKSDADGYGEIYVPEQSIFKPAKKKETHHREHLKQVADISEWSNFSRTPHTEEEIREKILTDYHNVCFTYLCGDQILSEEFIPELAALSTGLLNKWNYTSYIDYLKRAVMITKGIIDEPYDLTKLPQNAGITKKNVATLTSDRLDWKAIEKKQNLSPEFYRTWVRKSPLLRSPDGRAQSSGVG